MDVLSVRPHSRILQTAVGATLLPLALFAVTLLSSCGGKFIEGPISDSIPIPFDLVLPIGLEGFDYYAIAGTQGNQEDVPVGDSIVSRSVWRFYAQFAPAPGNPVDFDIYINTTKLQQNLSTDTFRLGTTFDTEIAEGEQTWHLREPGETQIDITRFILPSVARLDTIAPFEELREKRGSIRSDSAFTLYWQPGDGGNIKIEWITDNATVVRDAQDFAGSFTIPKEVMTQLRGKGVIRVTRYRAVDASIRGKSIRGIRLSQRTYETYVQ